jgi:CRISPR/Cas system-associated endoribonuclease Cas2
MSTRYISYDINSKNEYTKLYELLEKWNAAKVTESTYKLQSEMEFHSFCEEIKKATNAGDSITVIYRTKDALDHKRIR